MQLSLRTLQNLFTTIKRTALYDLHIENKGKMVEFAGSSYSI